MIDVDALVAFINARLDALEAWAREAHDAMPQAVPMDGEAWARYFDGVQRDVEVTRRIIDLHQPKVWCGSATCMTCMESVPPFEHRDWPCETLALVTARWCDHPDYDTAWSPA